ncbi:MAG: carboxymuconolactone decarboxylase family protein [Proteobacteria bacterium]|nr:carboxymuconolactone decarboxylase family protein [Pseudomonadota bacterium]
MTASARLEIRDFITLLPGLYDALAAVSKTAEEAGLSKELVELVKIRASQINGCAYCIQYHLNLARSVGVGMAKLDLLPAWREAPVYSQRERAALMLTERLTQIAGHEVDDTEFAFARAEFSEKELAALLGAIGIINTWNRIGVTYRFTPPAAR